MTRLSLILPHSCLNVFNSACSFKSEHEARISAETELAQLREQRLGMEQQVWIWDDAESLVYDGV